MGDGFDPVSPERKRRLRLTAAAVGLWTVALHLVLTIAGTPSLNSGHGLPRDTGGVPRQEARLPGDVRTRIRHTRPVTVTLTRAAPAVRPGSSAARRASTTERTARATSTVRLDRRTTRRTSTRKGEVRSPPCTRTPAEDEEAAAAGEGRRSPSRSNPDSPGLRKATPGTFLAARAMSSASAERVRGWGRVTTHVLPGHLRDRRDR